MRGEIAFTITWMTSANYELIKARTLRRMMSSSEYFMPRTSTGTSLSMCGPSTSLQMGCSASESQNSHASSATPSSLSCVRSSMYCKQQARTWRHTRVRARQMPYTSSDDWLQLKHIYQNWRFIIIPNGR